MSLKIWVSGNDRSPQSALRSGLHTVSAVITSLPKWCFTEVVLVVQPLEQMILWSGDAGISSQPPQPSTFRLAELREDCSRLTAARQTILSHPALRPGCILGFTLRTSVDRWESRARPPNQGSMAAAALPAFLLPQTFIRRKAWNFGGWEEK